MLGSGTASSAGPRTAMGKDAQASAAWAWSSGTERPAGYRVPRRARRPRRPPGQARACDAADRPCRGARPAGAPRGRSGGTRHRAPVRPDATTSARTSPSRCARHARATWTGRAPSGLGSGPRGATASASTAPSRRAARRWSSRGSCLQVTISPSKLRRRAPRAGSRVSPPARPGAGRARPVDAGSRSPHPLSPRPERGAGPARVLCRSTHPSVQIDMVLLSPACRGSPRSASVLREPSQGRTVAETVEVTTGSARQGSSAVRPVGVVSCTVHTGTVPSSTSWAYTTSTWRRPAG